MSESAQWDAPHSTSGNGDIQFGSNVSRLKSRFLQNVSDVAQPTSGSYRQVIRQHSSPSSTSVSSVTNRDFLQDMTDHVQKFRHTRAMFAQLAEQTAPVRPSPLPRSLRSTSSASPPPIRPSYAHSARRSVSPSNDLQNTRKFGQTVVTTLPQTNGSVMGVTTWSQLGSRSLEESSRSQGQSSWRDDAVEVTGVVLRRNKRPSMDLPGRAVLLPKRRSREEKTLTVSKDCLEASLCQADEYWRCQQMEEVDPLMSESTFSSGSGEEMARSESGHDLAAALKDTTVSPTADSAEIWSRRLSAAMEAKTSETDNVAADCNGANHVSSRTTENSVGVASSRSSCGHVDLENTAASVTRSHALCDLELTTGGSSVEGSATDYNDHMTLGINSLLTSDPSRSNAVQCNLESSVTVCEAPPVNRTSCSEDGNFEVDKMRTFTMSRTLSDRCGSAADCDVLEGSVTDCECKDVDTEKSSLQPNSTETVDCRTSTDDNDDNDRARLQQQEEVLTVADGGVQQSGTLDTCSNTHLQDNVKSDIHHAVSQLVEDLSVSNSLCETTQAAEIVLHEPGRDFVNHTGPETSLSPWSSQRNNNVEGHQGHCDDVQIMSVSEDDESSGETDYVVLGEPVSKKTARQCTAEAVNQSNNHT